MTPLTPRRQCSAASVLRERLEESLAAGAITTVDIVDFLDEVEPWAKQHVFLFDGGDGLVEGWQDMDTLRGQLAEANVAELLDGRLPLGLPGGAYAVVDPRPAGAVRDDRRPLTVGRPTVRQYIAALKRR